MAVLQVRLDDKLKDEAQKVAQGLGMDLTTAVRIFLNQMVIDSALPFKPELDPFFSRKNQNALHESIEEGKSRKFIPKTLAELKAME